MVAEAVEMVKSFAQALGFTADTGRPRDDLSLGKATEERRFDTTSKGKPFDKTCEARPEMRALTEEQRHSYMRNEAVAAGQVASERSMARSGKGVTHGRSSSAPKINLLNEDMLGDSEGDKYVSQRSKEQQGHAKLLSKERELSVGDKYKNLKHEHSRLQRKLQDMDLEARNLTDENRQIKTEKKALEKEFHSLAGSFSVIEDRLLRPYAEATGHGRYTTGMLQMLLHEAFEANTLKQRTHHYQEQIISFQKKEQSLQEHVTALQRELLSNVEKASIVSDEHFTQDFRWLATSIKTLSRNIHFPDGIELADIPAIVSARLLINLDNAHWNGRGRKKALIEAFLWSVLISKVFGSPFGIAGLECSSDIDGWWAKLFGTSHLAGWPLPSDLAERWRTMTMNQMVKLVGKEIITHGIATGQVAEFRQDIFDSILKGRNTVYQLITQTLGELSPATDFRQVPVIIDKAFTLALEMSTQRCRLQVVYPNIGDPYSQGQPAYLKNIHDEEEVDKGTVAVVVNPGLVKWGDGHGKNLDQELVLVPCEVIIATLSNDGASTEMKMSSSNAQVMQTGYDDFMETPKFEDHRTSAQNDTPTSIEDLLAEFRPPLGGASS
ncbi:hypothetical protein SLS60_008137 [Paraconiothyrium brasiliense]|uniref:Uncharacterized protein n=1 Tax=Paraconiothyrium brasiliense TaxID=300254 RepID=A0ABR3R3K3_9PLEO